ncbi:MAG TPA: Panacea domain-containing protein [Gammaproteobacteria bacterium]|nr:Panacea domain-containing protein [Gammaproteobacteria bacterium]
MIKTIFSPNKSLAAILHVANQSSGVSFHTLSKVLYFADRESLSEFGRTISGDRYIAMRHGPVPSSTYDMLKAVRDNHPWHPQYETLCESFEVRNNYRIFAKKAPDYQLLSKSDTMCLDQAIKTYGRMSFSKLTEASHDEAWKSADENDAISMEAIVRSLPDGDILMEHLRNPHPGRSAS